MSVTKNDLQLLSSQRVGFEYSEKRSHFLNSLVQDLSWWLLSSFSFCDEIADKKLDLLIVLISYSKLGEINVKKLF